jgi:hypothetical protein
VLDFATSHTKVGIGNAIDGDKPLVQLNIINNNGDTIDEGPRVQNEHRHPNVWLFYIVQTLQMERITKLSINQENTMNEECSLLLAVVVVHMDSRW